MYKELEDPVELVNLENNQAEIVCKVRVVIRDYNRNNLIL